MQNTKLVTDILFICKLFLTSHIYTLLLTWDLFFLSPTKGPNFLPFKIDFVAQTPERIHINNYNKSDWSEESSFHNSYFLRSLYVSVSGCAAFYNIKITARKLKFTNRHSNKPHPQTPFSHIRFKYLPGFILCSWATVALETKKVTISLYFKWYPKYHKTITSFI